MLVLGAGLAAAAVPCTTDADCTGDEACVGGGCVPPVDDPHAYAAAAAGRWSSYWWAVQFPALFEPSELCCFDYTGDGIADDATGALLSLIAPLLSLDPQTAVDQDIENGSFVEIMDWRELAPDLASGDVQVSLFLGQVSDAAPFTVRRAGLGRFVLELSSFGSHGALNQLNDGSVAAGSIAVGGNSVMVPLLLPNGGGFVGELDDPRLEADVVYDDSAAAPCHGLCTVDEDRGPGHVPQIVGGARLGGYFHAEDVYDAMDDFYRGCGCAGVDPGQPVIQWASNGTVISPSCTGNTGSPASCPPEDPCSELGTMCSVLPLLGNAADVDRDDDGVFDSFSAGFRIAWSGAAINGVSTDVFADGFESGDTSAWGSTAP